MEPVSDRSFLVFVAGAWQVERVIVHRGQARSHMGVYFKCGSEPAREGASDHSPDFNRVNARINARLNALPLSFLLYNDARTACAG